MCKIQFFLLNAWCGCSWQQEERPPVSCRSDLALACYLLLLLLLLHTEQTSCFFVQLPITLQGNCPLPSSLVPPIPTHNMCQSLPLSSFLQLDPPEFGLSALVRGVRLFRQLAWHFQIHASNFCEYSEILSSVVALGDPLTVASRPE